MKNLIDKELKQAMLSGDSVARETLRSVKAEITRQEKENGTTLDDSKVSKIIDSLIKKRKESAEIYRTNNRADLAEKEEAEIKVLSLYAIKKLSEEETLALVERLISEGATNIGMIMKQLSQDVDKKLVQEIYKKLTA